MRSPDAYHARIQALRAERDAIRRGAAAQESMERRNALERTRTRITHAAQAARILELAQDLADANGCTIDQALDTIEHTILRKTTP